jgi:hypothetical protein
VNDNLFSYDGGNERGKLKTADSNKNKMSIEHLNRQSLLKNKEIVLQVDNVGNK